MGKTKIMALGGSVAAGTGAKLDVFHDCFQYESTTVNTVRDTQTWWSILERLLGDWIEGGAEVINAGGGATENASECLGRVEGSVAEHAPDYVLVLLGPQGALQGVEAEAFAGSLKQIVDRIAAAGAAPV